MDWFYKIADRLRDYSDGDVWSAGDEILFRTESAAAAFADMLHQLYAAQDEEVTVIYGFYDPEEDKRAGTEDRFTGWWYVNIE